MKKKYIAIFKKKIEKVCGIWLAVLRELNININQ